MDPLTAMAIIAIVTTGATLYAGNKASNEAAAEQERLRKEQEAARIASTQREMGLAQQRTNTALSSASSRPKNAAAPSFSSNSVMGGLPSVSGDGPTKTGSGMGSAGTF